MLSLVQAIQKRLFLLSVAGVGTMMLLLLAVLWVQNRDLHDRVHAEAVEYHRSQVFALMQMAKSYVDGEMNSTEDRLKTELVSQINLAWSMVELAERMHGDLPRDQLVKHIAESIRHIRFRNGSGYFFMTGFDSVEILYPPNPKKYEGNTLFWNDPATRSVLAAQNQIAIQQGSGFHSYRWLKPGSGNVPQRKLTYVRAHPKLKFILGTGLYESEIVPQIQEDVLEQLSKLNVGLDAYFFAVNWDGFVELGPAKGRNMLHVKDKDGIPVVKRLIELSQAGGGYLEYHMPTEVSDASVHKLSYVIGIPEWRWYIGVGRDIKNVESMIASREKEMILQSFGIVGIALILGIFLLMISNWISRKISLRFGTDLGQFIQYYRNAGLSLEPLPVSEIQYSELKALATDANTMVHQLRQLAQENDITLRSLKEKNEELEQILFIAGHDLRTPLVTLQGFATELDGDCNILLTDISENERNTILRDNIPQANKYIQQASKKMEALIMGISRYGRLGRIQPEFVHIDMKQICEECLGSLGAMLQGVEFHVDFRDVQFCYADSMLTTQICTNIIENAVKYSDPDRVLTLSINSKRVGNDVLFTFADNGIGIPSKDLQRIFGIFIRLNKKPNVSGDGMGLAISYRLAKIMGGDLLVESDEGVGSAFILKLPAEQ